MAQAAALRWRPGALFGSPDATIIPPARARVRKFTSRLRQTMNALRMHYVVRLTLTTLS